MTLVLQTTTPGRIFVWLVRGRKVVAEGALIIPHRNTDRALVLIDQTLRHSHRTIADVSGVLLVRGPGSFTAVRSGLIIANTLGWLLNIPVQGIITNHQLSRAEVVGHVTTESYRRGIVKPWYGKKPNISSPRPVLRQATAKR